MHMVNLKMLRAALKSRCITFVVPLCLLQPKQVNKVGNLAHGRRAFSSLTWDEGAVGCYDSVSSCGAVVSFAGAISLTALSRVLVA